MHVEQDIHIARPPEEVFAVVTDPERLPEWQKGTVEVRRARSGPLSVGERLDEVHAAFGRRIESAFEVTTYEPGREFALRALEGPVRLDGRWEFASDAGGTRLHFTGSGPVAGWMKPMIALQFKRHHRRLKQIIER